MKYISLTLIFLTFNLYGQKCKYLTNKVSGMDGSRLVITEPQNLSHNFGEGTIDVWSTIYGDTSLIVAFVFKKQEKLILKKGNSIIVILENDEELNLELIQDPSYKKDGDDWILTALISVNNKSIKQFHNHSVKKIRVNFSETEIEGTTEKKNNSIAIKRVINCVIEYLN